MEYTKQIKKVSKYNIGDIVLVSFDAQKRRQMIGIITNISINEKENDFSFTYTIAIRNQTISIDEYQIGDHINKLSYIDILNNIEKYNIGSNKEKIEDQLPKSKYRKGDIIIFKDLYNHINKDIITIPDSIGLIRSIEVREDGYIDYYISYINHNKKRLLTFAQIDTTFIQEECIKCIANPSLIISEYLIDDFNKLIRYKEKHNIYENMYN